MSKYAHLQDIDFGMGWEITVLSFGYLLLHVLLLEYSAARTVLLLRLHKWCLAARARELRRGRDWSESER